LVTGFNYILGRKKKKKKIYIYMKCRNVVLDLQPRSEAPGATLKPKGSSITTTNL
jgi:hypothetical protein